MCLEKVKGERERNVLKKGHAYFSRGKYLRTYQSSLDAGQSPGWSMNPSSLPCCFWTSFKMSWPGVLCTEKLVWVLSQRKKACSFNGPFIFILWPSCYLQQSKLDGGPECGAGCGSSGLSSMHWRYEALASILQSVDFYPPLVLPTPWRPSL